MNPSTRPGTRLRLAVTAVVASLLTVSTTLLAPSPAVADPTGSAAPSTTAEVQARGTGPFAPLHRASPALRESPASLRDSLTCNGRLTRPHRGQPILLVPGTYSTPQQNFSFNYVRAFRQQGRAFCAVRLPRASTGDAQVGAERIVHALRVMHRRSGQKIDVLGFSLGGMLPRFAFRFFPDTRRLVDDFVALAPTNHGALTGNLVCALSRCQPAVLQQVRGANFIRATNSGQQTFGPIDYTVVFTRTDEIATPNLTNRGTSSLRRDSPADVINVPIQRICPLNLNEHTRLGTVDPVAYALALDAFDNPGVAQPSRISRRVCGRLLAPGVIPGGILGYLSAVARNAVIQPRASREPSLRRYTLR